MLRLTRGATAITARAAAASTRTQRLAPVVAVGCTRSFHAARAAPAGLRFAAAADASERSSRAAAISSSEQVPADAHQVIVSDQQQESSTHARQPKQKQPPSPQQQGTLTPANLRPDPRIDDAINRAEGRRDFSSSAPVSSGSHNIPIEVPQPITPGSDFDTVAAAAAAPHIGEDFAAPSAASAHNQYEFMHPKAAAAASEAPSVEQAIKEEDSARSGKGQGKQAEAEGEIPVEYPRGSSSSSSSSRRPRKDRSPFDPFSFLSSLPLPPLPLPRPSTLVSQLPPPLRDLAKLAAPENLHKVANEVAESVAGGMRSTAKTTSGSSSAAASRSSSSSRGADALGNLFPTPSNLSHLASSFVPLAAKGLPGLVNAMPSPTAVLNLFGHVTSPAAATKPWGAARSDSSSSTAAGSGSNVTHTSSSRPRGARRPSASKPLRSDLLAEMLRVDHAGEYGAQRIYDGQLFVLGAGKRPGRNGQSFAQATAASTGASASDVIEEMRAQEIEHLRTLERLLPEYRVRPTALLPLWNVAGFALGAGSALLGPKAAMACTVAVEDVITAHYNDQLRTLNSPGFADSTRESDHRLKSIIKRHRDDEQHHKAIGIEHKAEEAPAYRIMTQIIQAGCQAAIWISKKV